MSQRELLTRETVTVVEDTGQVQDLLDGLTLDDCFHPETWPGLVGIAQIVPDGEVLPVRAAYGAAPGWNIGLNHFHTDQPVWYIMADLAAAKLRTGTAP